MAKLFTELFLDALHQGGELFPPLLFLIYCDTSSEEQSAEENW